MGSLATQSGYPGVATWDDDEKRHRRQIAVVVNNLLAGKMNNTGDLTLTDNSATTTLTNPRIGANSTILMMPTTAHAAAALSGVYFTDFDKGSCTVNHANNAQTDRIFKYVVIG